ncbi:MAG TPA: dTMP kinase [Thermoplasmata archaeon]|nr:dTMP kinase [Thermoplasmata archaeon]
MKPRARGKLVAVEGVDGAGKSTFVRGLADALRKDGYTVSLWREPTDSAISARAIAAGTDQPWTAALFFTLDRAHARPALERLLDRSDLVLSDRSFYSTLAYQGSRFPPRDRPGLAALERAVAHLPDRVVWLRISPSVALRRVRTRGKPPAPLERIRTLRGVARTYGRLARAPGWIVVDALQPVDALVADVRRHLAPLLSRLRPRARRPRR